MKINVALTKTKLLFIAGMITMGIILMIITPGVLSKNLIRKDCDTAQAMCFYAIRYNKMFSSQINFTVARYVKTGLPDSGHSVTYPFPFATSNADEDNEIKKGSIQFTEDGVTYTHPTNHILFIPKKSYINGR